MDPEKEPQVLSISYGAFSIRLEGFDDPFPIIQRVTDYFRQVAQADSSFGTLPLEQQHLEMGNFANTLRAEGTGVDMAQNEVLLRPQTATTAAAIPEPTAQDAPESAPLPQSEEQKRAEIAALTKAMSTAHATAERTEEIKRRLEIIRDQTVDVSEKYDSEDKFQVGYPFLKGDDPMAEDELVFIHPLRSKFRKMRLQAGGEQMTGTDGGTRLRLSPEMRTIEVKG